MEVIRELQDLNTRRGPDPRESEMTRKVLGIEWSKHFPIEVESGGSIRMATYEECQQFIASNFREIFGEDFGPGRFLNSGSSPSRDRYYQSLGDCLAIEQDGTMVGAFVGNLMDWGTYHFRYAGFLKAVQGAGFCQAMIRHLENVLAGYGVERIEADVSPLNRINIHLLNKTGYTITGFQMSERFGALLKFTKYLSNIHRDTFAENFCHGPKPSWKERRGNSHV